LLRCLGLLLFLLLKRVERLFLLVALIEVAAQTSLAGDGSDRLERASYWRQGT
jgi:hypothetical protein